MTVSVEMVADSISLEGIRLTTLILSYPKFIHGELMTHRVFSRNASSSRAIPVSKLLYWIKYDPAEPIHWGLNERGMQAHTEATGLRLWLLKKVWRSARRTAMRRAWLMSLLGGHKQIVNRLVESHGHIRVLVTSTYWKNFHMLRDHPDAAPEICRLSQLIQEEMEKSIPDKLLPGDWHLPFVKEKDYNVVGYAPIKDVMTILRRVSAARCARVSYWTVDGSSPTIDADLKLYERLAGGIPIHASPLEHQATPDELGYFGDKMRAWKNRDKWGNFYGWCQHRKYIPGESTSEVFPPFGERASDLLPSAKPSGSDVLVGVGNKEVSGSDVNPGASPEGNRPGSSNVVAKKSRRRKSAG